MTGETMIRVSTAVFNKYFYRYGDIREDLINEGVIGIIKGLSYFRKERGSFSTFLFICAKRNMQLYLKKELRFRGVMASDCIEDVMNFIPDANGEMEVPYDASGEINKMREVVNELSVGKRDIANDLLDCKTPKELVAKYGVTKQRVSQVYVALKNKAVEMYKFEDGYLVKRSEND